MSVLVGSNDLSKRVDIVMTASAPEAAFASRSRIATRTGKMETEESPQDTYGLRQCMVPAEKKHWVHLQFHTGLVWVPEKQRRVGVPFLLLACDFPSAPSPLHLEDNMLCPKCVRKNKVLMKSLR